MERITDYEFAIQPPAESVAVEALGTIDVGNGNCQNLELQVNGTYPKGAALATTPPAVLQAFPKLPEGIEYRFVGCRLILMAHDSRVVIDHTTECFW